MSIYTDWPGYGVQKQRALSKAKGDWVFNLDADESVSEALQQEIKKAMYSGNVPTHIEYQFR